MLVAQLDFADPEFPASLVEKPEPALPGPAWARVQVTGGGICEAVVTARARDRGEIQVQLQPGSQHEGMAR